MNTKLIESRLELNRCSVIQNRLMPELQTYNIILGNPEIHISATRTQS